MTSLINRAGPRCVALETTLLAHGVPAGEGPGLARDLARIVRDRGAIPALVGVLRGAPIVGMTDDELDSLLAGPSPAKANSANLGLLMHARANAATTVSATMELAAAAGVRVFATGGLGGVHRDAAMRLDVSSDLGAFVRFPVAVVCSGVKGLLDVESTRELLETLGVPVVGFGTDRFPAFYQRESGARVDARFDDARALASFVAAELARTGRGVVVANPIPAGDEVPQPQWDRWLAAARSEAAPATGREVTPRVLDALHRVSGGATLRANLSLVRSNAALAADIATALPPV